VKIGKFILTIGLGLLLLGLTACDAVDTDILPLTDNTYSIGEDGLAWADSYVYNRWAWDGAAWVALTPGGGALALDDLTDVVCPAPNIGDVIIWDGADWVNQVPAGGATPVTLIVGANDSLDKTRADYECDGADDDVQILAALAALPASGGTVQLLEGTYNCEASIALTSYDRLVGNGRGTILTTTTANLDIITATGGAGSEKVGITIADLCVDGNAGGAANDVGILWTYVDYSAIHNVWSLNNGEHGINLVNSDWNRIENNTCQGNTQDGISLEDNTGDYPSQGNNIISGNICQDNRTGIALADGSRNVISGNVCHENSEHGIYLGPAMVGIFECSVIGNSCWKN